MECTTASKWRLPTCSLRQRFGAAGFGQRPHSIGIASRERDFGAGVEQRASGAARRSAVSDDQNAGFGRPQMS